jgi:hypothetical protein
VKLKWSICLFCSKKSYCGLFFPVCGGRFEASKFRCLSMCGVWGGQNLNFSTRNRPPTHTTAKGPMIRSKGPTMKNPLGGRFLPPLGFSRFGFWLSSRRGGRRACVCGSEDVPAVACARVCGVVVGGGGEILINLSSWSVRHR